MFGAQRSPQAPTPPPHPAKTLYVYIYMHMYIYICKYIRVCIIIYIYTYLVIHIHIYTHRKHTYTHKHPKKRFISLDEDLSRIFEGRLQPQLLPRRYEPWLVSGNQHTYTPIICRKTHNEHHSNSNTTPNKKKKALAHMILAWFRSRQPCRDLCGSTLLIPEEHHRLNNHLYHVDVCFNSIENTGP